VPQAARVDCNFSVKILIEDNYARMVKRHEFGAFFLFSIIRFLTSTMLKGSIGSKNREVLTHSYLSGPVESVTQGHKRLRTQ
jgi:hypothetical protein